MAEYTAKRSPDLAPTHPGQLLKNTVIPATGKTMVEIAALLGISRQHLYDIMSAKKPISPAFAAKMGKLFGNGPGLWLRMQASYDAWHVAREIDVSNIPTLESV